jgi:ribosome biogenesis GTPase
MKAESDLFVLDTADGFIKCAARKTLKKNRQTKSKASAIVAGDFVYTTVLDGAEVISGVAERKNCLTRPRAANVDQIIAVVASVPKPDFFLIDKLIINAVLRNINVVLCLNKNDLKNNLMESLKRQYKNAVDKIIVTSAADGDIGALAAVLKNKFSCLAGQSAVGKSSLVNAVLGLEIQKTGEVSYKNERGKNTTTRAEIIKLDNDSFLLDSPGFSMLDIHGVDPYELDLYYPEFLPLNGRCRYRRCTHTSEPDCMVREAAENGEISCERYERYRIMLDELKKRTRQPLSGYRESD